jgi:hypothetical protein
MQLSKEALGRAVKALEDLAVKGLDLAMKGLDRAVMRLEDEQESYLKKLRDVEIEKMRRQNKQAAIAMINERRPTPRS